MSTFEITTAGTNDMPLFRDWSIGEGWNPGDLDIITGHAADPRGFFLGRLDGKPVASISAVRYGAGFGFLGHYIAQEAVRGQGYAIQLWRQAMEHLAGRNIGLDAGAELQPRYRGSGFRHAWNHIRYEGVATVDETPAGIELVEGRTIAFDRLLNYDRRFFPAPREAFLSLLVTLPTHLSVAALRDGELVGFGVVRSSYGGRRIGPLYASSDDVALAILNHLAAFDPSSRLTIDVPDVNGAAIEVVERLGLEPTAEYARMYTGGIPALDLAGIFATGSLELG